MIDLFTILIVAIIIAISYLLGYKSKLPFAKIGNRSSKIVRYFENGKQVDYANIYDIWHKSKTGWDHNVAIIKNGEILYYTNDELISHRTIIENS